MDHVAEVADKTVSFIHARGVINRQFDNLDDECVSYGFPYHTEVR